MNRHERVQKVARDFYATYNDTGPNRWRTHDGKQVPQFDATGDQVQAKWGAVASRALTEAEIAIVYERRRAVRANVLATVVAALVGSLITSALWCVL